MLFKFGVAVLIALLLKLLLRGDMLGFSSHSLSHVRAANHAARSLRGHTAVVVGGTSGIGRGVAVRLARQGAGVTIIGRSSERAAHVLAELQAASGPDVKHDFLFCNSFLLQDIQARSVDWLRAHPTLEILVLSQGVGTIQGFTPTSEGRRISILACVLAPKTSTAC